MSCSIEKKLSLVCRHPVWFYYSDVRQQVIVSPLGKLKVKPLHQVCVVCVQDFNMHNCHKENCH